MGQKRLRQKLAISIHALLAESDVLNPFKTFIILTFLSTLSLRRATGTCPVFPLSDPAISIHALLAESDHPVGDVRRARDISIHALLAESDPGIQRLVALLRQFLSTLSLRRATQNISGLGIA